MLFHFKNHFLISRIVLSHFSPFRLWFDNFRSQIFNKLSISTLNFFGFKKYNFMEKIAKGTDYSQFQFSNPYTFLTWCRWYWPMKSNKLIRFCLKYHYIIKLQPAGIEGLENKMFYSLIEWVSFLFENFFLKLFLIIC